MQLKYIDASRKKEWEDLVKANSSSGFMQSFFWTNLKQLLGWETFKIGIFEKNKLVGGAIITKFSHFKDFNFLSIAEGPVLPYEKKEAEEMFHQLIGEIDKISNLTGGKLTSHLSIEPKLTKVPKYFSRFQKSKMDQQPIKTLIIDLTLSQEELLKQMKPKGRYNIKIAQKHKLQVFQANLYDGLRDFLKLYKQFVKRDKFEGKDDSYFESLAYVLPKRNESEFFFVKKGKEILASALIVYYGDTATFLYGAMTEKHKETMASYLLHWEIIKNAKERGLKRYDFYSLSPTEDISHPWYGFSIFKRKFGGKEENYIGGYDFVYNQKLYKEYLKTSLSSK